MIARTLMIQGTSSSVGKSILTTAICRILSNEGLRVAPFKSQNMALNAFVTPAGFEMSRAQAVQAEAARCVPAPEMNPILLKPEGNARSQVVVLGKSMGSMSAIEYHQNKAHLKEIVAKSLAHLRQHHDVVVIEGAGSPAEINLKEHELVNMFVAGIADAPVLLVGDIDRGGVFASIVGTLELLDPHERARVKGFLINKFRGDIRLLDSGLRWLEDRTGVPVLGVVAHLERLRIADEDSLSLDHRSSSLASGKEISIAVIRTPRISNYDDFDPLAHEPSAHVAFIEDPTLVRRADLVILPGSKCTVDDLAWLRQTGFAAAILKRAAEGRPILGICGGFQMLGERIEDPQGIESQTPITEGLGLLPVMTRFEAAKVTAQTQARVQSPSLLTDGLDGEAVSGYEIHHGQVYLREGHVPIFSITHRNGAFENAVDGATSSNGQVTGTLLHGILNSPQIRQSLLNRLRGRIGTAPSSVSAAPSQDAEYDRLAEHVKQALDWPKLRQMIGMEVTAKV